MHHRERRAATSATVGELATCGTASTVVALATPGTAVALATYGTTVALATYGTTVAPAMSCRVAASSATGRVILHAPFATSLLAIMLLAPSPSPSLAAPPPNAHNNVAAAEPSGYWTGPINAPTPLSITGGTVIHNARQLRALLQQGGAVVVDVSNAPRRPENLAPGAPWLPLPHRAIPGSLWIPDVGQGEIPVAVDDFYRQRLAAATQEHLARPVIIYCHKTCWLSWNAAKRAISYGYRNVYWYRDGIEGWKSAGYPTSVIEPQVAPEKQRTSARRERETVRRR